MSNKVNQYTDLTNMPGPYQAKHFKTMMCCLTLQFICCCGAK